MTATTTIPPQEPEHDTTRHHAVAYYRCSSDDEGAFRIVVLTLKLLWTQTVAVLKKGWIGFKQAIADGLKFVMDLFGLSVKDLVSAFVAIEKAWVHTTAFLSDAWNTFTAGFMKVWNKAKGFVAKGIMRLKKLFGAKVDVDAATREIDAEDRSGRIANR